MPRVSRSVAPILLVACLLAGCMGGAGAPAAGSVSPDPLADVGGTIAGLVISTEAAPIANAQVSVDKGPLTVTAADGRFVVGDLTVGSHDVFVGALGFESVARRVEVFEDRPASVTFTLNRTPVQVPYLEVLPFRGFSICDYMAYVVSGRLPSPCDSGQAKTQFKVQIRDGMEFLVVEMKWQGGFANSDTFRLFTADDGDCVNTSPCYGLVYGRGYARVEGEPGKTDVVKYYDPWMDMRGPPYPANDTWTLVVNGQWIGAFASELGGNPACQAILQAATGAGYKPGCLGFGVSTGIPYELYVSVFHRMQPTPRGPCCPVTTYSALPDG